MQTLPLFPGSLFHQFLIYERPLEYRFIVKHSFNRVHYFRDGDSLHTTKIDRAIPQKTGATFYMMPDNGMTGAKGSSQSRLRRTE